MRGAPFLKRSLKAGFRGVLSIVIYAQYVRLSTLFCLRISLPPRGTTLGPLASVCSQYLGIDRDRVYEKVGYFRFAVYR